MDYTIEDFKRVVWSDETKICKFGTGGRQYCTVLLEDQRTPDYGLDHHVLPTVKFGGGAIFCGGAVYRGVKK